MTTPSYRPPPDTTGYLDLRVFDRSDQEIIETALAQAQINMPEWTPREGHTEVLLIEALALEMAEAVVAINRLPGATLETLLRFAGVGRDFGAAPTATATIHCADATGHSIPGGTRIYAPTADGAGTVVMLVEPPGAEIPTGQTSATVSLIADIFTDAANGVPAGTLLQMVSHLPFVESVVLNSPITDGRSPETDEVWRDRGVNRLARLSEALVLPRHFEAAALENANVARCVVVDNYDPNTPETEDPGHVTVAVLGDGGALLSEETKAEIEAELEDAAIAVLQVHVVDLTIVLVTISVQVHPSDASDPDAVTAAVARAIDDYLDPLTWTYGGTVRRNEIVSLVDQVFGVDWVGEVVIQGANAAGDLILPEQAAVPSARPDTITVTIV